MKDRTQFHMNYWMIAILVFLGLQYLLSIQQEVATIPYSEFEQHLKEGRVEELAITERRIEGLLKEPLASGQRRFISNRVEPQLAEHLQQYPVRYTGKVESTLVRDLLSWIVPAMLFFGIWLFLLKRIGSGLGGGGMMPQTYGRLGGRMPKGVLLVGPPGTGKTLLARAVAGEAKVPFFSISGSEFVEMFVGVGAARVRDLFEQARAQAPAIIFIDELDALGRARGPGGMSGQDEKEQTLNQLLVEMDGFDTSSGLVLLAATNRPEILDPALLRAGRFDRQVLVDRPDKVGRVQILNVHLKKSRLGTDVDPQAIAALTPGFTGADLANLVNEATLLATRRNAEAVAMEDFTAAIERIIAGLEKRNRLLNPREREIVAYHEMGHALVAMALPGVDPVHKVSIIPRGMGALGYTIQRPIEDRFLMTRDELENKMAVLLGGRAAEWLVFAHLSTGAADDLAKVTDIARAMVTRYGMSKRLGHLALEREPNSFLGNEAMLGLKPQHDYAESTATAIDEEVQELVQSAFQRSLGLLEERHELLERCARRLLQQETLDADELRELSAAPASDPVQESPQA